MINNVRQSTWRQFLCVSSIFGCVLTGSLISPVLSAAEDDEYLKAITMEGEKVGGGGDTSQGGGGGLLNKRAGDGFSSGMSAAEFESELQSKYAGSAVFYKKLEKRNQIEIYDAYLKGESYAEVRKKIMARFLKRR